MSKPLQGLTTSVVCLHAKTAVLETTIDVACMPLLDVMDHDGVCTPVLGTYLSLLAARFSKVLKNVDRELDSLDLSGTRLQYFEYQCWPSMEVIATQSWSTVWSSELSPHGTSMMERLFEWSLQEKCVLESVDGESTAHFFRFVFTVCKSFVVNF